MKKVRNLVAFAVIAISGFFIFAACSKLNAGSSQQQQYYEVTFNSMDGSSVPKITDVESGSLITKPDDPIYFGYAFEGWFKDNILSNSWDWEIDTVTSNVILYAKWLVIQNTLSFDTNGGNGVPSDVTATYDQNLPAISIIPTKTGYSFLGFFDAPTDGTKYYNDDLSSAKLWDKTTNTILYARWQSKTYTITFDKQGGTDGSNTATATYDETMPTSDIIAPVREGFTFDGYYTQPNGEGTKFYTNEMASAQIWNIDEDTILFAKWNDIFSYNLAGSGYSISAGKGAIFVGEVIIPSSYNGLPVIAIAAGGFRDNYALNGYARTNGITAFYIPNCINTIGANAFSDCTSLTSITIPSFLTDNSEAAFSGCKNLTIYLYEIVNKTSNYRTDYDSGYVVENCTIAVQNGYYYIASFEKAPGCISSWPDATGICAPTRLGYTFGGWTLTKGGTTATFTSESLGSAPNGMILYAIWIKN